MDSKSLNAMSDDDSEDRSSQADVEADVEGDVEGDVEAEEAVEVDPLEVLHAELAQLDARARGGANWFFWIAGLSLVNSVILLSGGNTHFVVGLGVTLIADLIGNATAEQHPDIATAIKGIVLAFDLMVAGIVCLFGWLSRRGILPVFALGMFLYLLDGLIYVLASQWLSVGFHAFVLMSMWSGFTAYRQMKAIKADLERQLAAGFGSSV